jgi:hypothetical protein
VLHFRLAFEGKKIMSAKTIGLLVSVAVLALAACAKKTETAVAAEDGEAVAEAPAAAPAIEVNEGEPIDGDVTLTVPATVMAGAEIDLSFTGPANRGDYIDIVPRGFHADFGGTELHLHSGSRQRREVARRDRAG